MRAWEHRSIEGRKVRYLGGLIQILINNLAYVLFPLFFFKKNLLIFN
jgi:hypothetical protein